MNPKELYIKVMHNGEESTFPVGEKAAILTDWTYTADRMGSAPIIEVKCAIHFAWTAYGR